MLTARQALEMYESIDLCRRFYRDVHGGDLATGKAQEVSAAMKQGRGYFESAATAPPLIRPLLTYYGVLSLARASVLFLDRARREASLAPQHGLECIGWKDAMHVGIKAVPELQIRVTGRGTFSEFLQYTNNKAYIVPNHPPGQDRIVLSVPLNAPRKDSVMTVGGIVGRLPYLQALLRSVLTRPTDAYPVWIFTLSETTQTDIAVMSLPGRFGPSLSAEEVRALFPSAATITESRAVAQLSGDLPNISVRLVHETLSDLNSRLPNIGPDRSGTNFLIAPFAPGFDLSSAGLLFAGSYVLGMLSRYFPQRWQELNYGAIGDEFGPVLKATLESIEANLPRCVLTALAGQPVLTADA